MDMDVSEDILEIDATYPDPDFFDNPPDQGGGGESSTTSSTMVSTGEVAADNQSAPAADSFAVGNVGAPASSQLKYDDEYCEFDEFLVALDPSNVEGRNAGETKKHTTDTEREKSVEKEEGSEDNENVEEKEKSGLEAGDTGVPPLSNKSSSGPNTPESRSSSGVVRISIPALPKVPLETKRISIRNESPSKIREPTPPRMTRGRLNAPKIDSSSTRSKRKLLEDEEDEESQGSVVSSTRSGRPVRKATRYGYEDDGESEHSISGNLEEVENGVALDSSMESDDLFEPISKTSYWLGIGDVTHFKDRKGTTIILQNCYVKLFRLTSSQLEKYSSSTWGDQMLMNHYPVLLEVCIDNFLSAKEAIKGGAKRIELCSSLAEGGLTPSPGFLQIVKEEDGHVPVFVMIRPRGGDFVYSEKELEIMTRDIEYFKEMGADGFVFGALTTDGEVDETSCKNLLQSAHPLPCTFHRAFDLTDDPLMALETIIDLGFSRILTSGQKATAQLGIQMLKQLVNAANDRITIMAGCGVNEKNVGDIVRKTGVKEVHGSASKAMTSAMKIAAVKRSSKSNKRQSASSTVKMGTTNDSVIKVTDSSIVWQMVKNLSQIKAFSC